MSSHMDCERCMGFVLANSAGSRSCCSVPRDSARPLKSARSMTIKSRGVSRLDRCWVCRVFRAFKKGQLTEMGSVGPRGKRSACSFINVKPGAASLTHIDASDRFTFAKYKVGSVVGLLESLHALLLRVPRLNWA